MRKALLISGAILALGAGVAVAHNSWKGQHGGYGGHGRHGGYHQGHHGGYGHKGRGGRRAERMEQRFTELDADGDGLVTKEEIEASRAKRFGAMDGNGDGAVDASELVEYHMMRRAERRIARLDKNKDGKLQADEMPQRQGLLRFDLDNNGSVSRAEVELGRGKRGGGGRHWGRGRGFDRDDAGPEEAAPDAPKPSE